jgi:outer membrane immunogenic protein
LTRPVPLHQVDAHSTGVFMIRIFQISLAAAVAVGFASIASAADMPVKAGPVVDRAFNWAGGYTGGNLGYTWSNDRVNAAQFAPVPPFLGIDTAAISSAATQNTKTRGFAGGLQAGYNWQSGNLVWGLEGDINYLASKKNTTNSGPFPSTTPGGIVGPPTVSFGVSETITNSWLFTARPRLGWASGNWLVYGTAGLAVGQVKFAQVVSLVSPFTEMSSVSPVLVGWSAGAGAEYAISAKWSVKAEYLYADLGRINTTSSSNPAFAGLFVNNSVRVTDNIARVGVNYHY